MNQAMFTYLMDEEKKVILPKKDDTPISASEQVAREEIRKLSENAEEIRKLREQIERNNPQNK